MVNFLLGVALAVCAFLIGAAIVFHDDIGRAADARSCQTGFVYLMNERVCVTGYRP